MSMFQPIVLSKPPITAEEYAELQRKTKENTRIQRENYILSHPEKMVDFLNTFNSTTGKMNPYAADHKAVNEDYLVWLIEAGEIKSKEVRNVLSPMVKTVGEWFDKYLSSHTNLGYNPALLSGIRETEKLYGIEPNNNGIGLVDNTLSNTTIPSQSIPNENKSSPIPIILLLLFLL